MKKIVLLLAIGLAVSGCATKRYGRLQPLSVAETQAYDCKDIRLELAKIGAFESNVADESKVDGRSALAFLADFGIGNRLERDDAERSARQRKKDLEALSVQKACGA